MGETMDRRTWLKGAFAAGGLMAAGRIPVLADEPSVFPARGRYERLALNYHKVEAGATKPFSLLHFSDTHLTATYGHEPQDVRENMRKRTVILRRPAGGGVARYPRLGA